MKQSSVLKILPPVLALLVLNQISTGIFHFDISKEVFGFVHRGSGILFGFIVLLHLAMNWNWVKTNYFKKKPKGQPAPGA
jgi:hypothetical protein